MMKLLPIQHHSKAQYSHLHPQQLGATVLKCGRPYLGAQASADPAPEVLEWEEGEDALP